MLRPTLFLSLSLALLLTACPSQTVKPIPNVLVNQDNKIDIKDADGNIRGTLVIPKGSIKNDGTAMLELEPDTLVPPPAGVKPVHFTTLSVMASSIDISSFGNSPFTSQAITVQPVVNLWIRYKPENLTNLLPRASTPLPPGTRLRMYQIKGNQWVRLNGEMVDTTINGVNAPLGGLGSNDIYTLGLEANPVSSIAIVGPNKIKYGSSVKYQAIAKDDSGTEIPNIAFDWQSSKPEIINIDSSGTATVADLSSDDVIISASVGGIKGQSTVSGYGVQTLIGSTRYSDRTITELAVKVRNKTATPLNSDVNVAFAGPVGWHNNSVFNLPFLKQYAWQIDTRFDNILFAGTYSSSAKLDNEDFNQSQTLNSSGIQGLPFSDTTGLSLIYSRATNSLTLQGKWPVVLGASSYLLQLRDSNVPNYPMELYTKNNDTNGDSKLTLKNVDSQFLEHKFFVELFATSIDVTQQYPSFSNGIRSSLVYNSIPIQFK